MRKFILLLVLMVAVPTTNMAETTAFPRFKCFTDRENEYLRGNVKKVVWHLGDGSSYEMEFNEQGNYSKISYHPLTGMGFPAHFGNRHHRYFYEGYVVNNYFDDFFRMGFTYAYFYNPFWLDGVVGGKGTVSFFYDTNGRLSTINAAYYDLLDKYEFVYDDKGHLITRKCDGLPMMKLRWQGDDIVGFYIYNEKGAQRYGYNFSISGNSIIIKPNSTVSAEKVEILTNAGGKIVSYTKTTYLGSNVDQVISKKCYYNGDGLIERLTSEIIERDGRRSTPSVVTYKYDNYKNIIECAGTTYEYTYDSYGNWTKKQAYTISRGDIVVKHKEGNPETREITYY